MTPQTFQNRIMAGKANNLVYSGNGKEGLICVWKYEDSFVLTWEECPAGEQYDESTYTRDEHFEFGSEDELFQFFLNNGLEVKSFTP